jgi:predicted amidohydrolase YtcJ
MIERTQSSAAAPPDGADHLRGDLLTARGIAFLVVAAAAAGLASVAGVIAPGRRADLSAFALDPLDVPPDEFAESPVPLTVVAGTVAHRDHDARG